MFALGQLTFGWRDLLDILIAGHFLAPRRYPLRAGHARHGRPERPAPARSPLLAAAQFLGLFTLVWLLPERFQFSVPRGRHSVPSGYTSGPFQHELPASSPAQGQRAHGNDKHRKPHGLRTRRPPHRSHHRHRTQRGPGAEESCRCLCVNLGDDCVMYLLLRSVTYC